MCFRVSRSLLEARTEEMCLQLSSWQERQEPGAVRSFGAPAEAAVGEGREVDQGPNGDRWHEMA